MSLLQVLQHALGRDEYGRSRGGRPDYRNHFCAGEGSADFAACREAVALELMVERAPNALSGGDYVFFVTDAGKAYVAGHSHAAPKLSSGQRRYRRYLEADTCLSFGEWLRRADT